MQTLAVSVLALFVGGCLSLPALPPIIEYQVTGTPVVAAPVYVAPVYVQPRPVYVPEPWFYPTLSWSWWYGDFHYYGQGGWHGRRWR